MPPSAPSTTPQYQRQQESYDFDVISSRFMAGLTPGDGLRIFFGSDSAKRPGTYNMSGVASPAIDALIDKVVEATVPRLNSTSPAGRSTGCCAPKHFWVPNWHKGSYWVAHWDKFGRPAIKPKYDRGIVDTWWYDEAKAAQIANGN